MIAIVQYRGSEIASFPAQAKDARTAVRRLREHAVKYHVDVDRIAMWGDSSGGHTTLMTYATGTAGADDDPAYSDEPASGQLTRSLETDWSKEEVEALADRVWKPTDMAAAIASGSFLTDGMVIAPCSMRTLGEIAPGVTSSLISRAADVHLKERRRLVLVTRETPLSLIHLRNMTAVTETGAIVVPPVPSLYTRPQTVDEVLDQPVGRCLDLLGVHLDRPRWGEGALAR